MSVFCICIGQTVINICCQSHDSHMLSFYRFVVILKDGKDIHILIFFILLVLYAEQKIFAV
jgi:hypothetical protein